MKRNNIILAGTVVYMAFFTSCMDVLDTQPFDKIGEDVVWSSKANAETFIYGTYGIMNNFNFGTNSDGRTLNLIGLHGNVYNTYSPIFSEGTDRNSNIGGFNNFSAIRRCNQIIEKVSASTGISENDKKELIAEGKFLRAMSYFQVARNIGRIVWIDRVLKPNDELQLPSTSNPTETYGYIIKDLEDAVAGLPTAKIPGRANKYVAAAFLSQVCLQAVAYKNYPASPEISGNDPLIEKAITYANMVVSEGGYTLENNYGDMFNDANPNSPEIIYAVYRKALNTACQDTPMQLMVMNVNNDRVQAFGGVPLFNSTTTFEAWLMHTPTYNLAKDYLVKDKKDPTKAIPWDQSSQYLENISESSSPSGDLKKQNNEAYVKMGTVVPSSNTSIWNLVNEGRDARWGHTFVTDNTSFLGETVTTNMKGNATRWMRINESRLGHLGLTNMYWRKGVYTNVKPRIYYGVNTDYHFVSMRLGKVYLNLAEAYLLKGDVSLAVEMLNKTRVTHGKLPASTASTLSEAWTDYKRERRVDLVLEDDYYYSLLRWGRYGGDANSGKASNSDIPELVEIPEVMDISSDGKSFSIVKGPIFSANNVRSFNHNRRYLFPIPQGMIDANSKLGPQNIGW